MSLSIFAFSTLKRSRSSRMRMAVNEGRTVTDIIVELVKAEVETKKEQSR